MTEPATAAALAVMVPPKAATPAAGPQVVPPPQAKGGVEGAAPAAPGEASNLVLPQEAPPPDRKKVLVVGDENLLFTTGLQEAYPDIEFTVSSVLSRQNLEAYNFDPLPKVLFGRVRHMVDPCRVGKHFPQQTFDSVMLFLPGLSFMVPRELGTADRPLFAYRTHLFVFHVLRHAKLVLKGEGHLHLVWPDEMSLMTSPCGAAGIEMGQLVQFCGCRPADAQLEMSKVEDAYFWPFLFGEVPTELPEWLNGVQIQTFTFDKSAISIPLSVALLLHPDVGFVTIKDPSSTMPSPMGAGTPLRTFLIHEASHRKDRLKEIYGPKDNPEDTVDAFGLVPEPLDEDSLLSMPMEIFMISFDDVPHISMLLKFQICDEQPQLSVASLDVLDPRLPTRIVRPKPINAPNPLLAVVGQLGPHVAAGLAAAERKRLRPQEEWGGMKFYCPLTKICTLTPDRMRLHMQGDLYKRLAASTQGWEESQDKKDLLQDLEDAEQLEEQQKRARKVLEEQGKGGGKGGKSKS